MFQLNPNWLTEGLIDFEYKKYLLLAYLQHVSNNFSDNRLYPFLSDLVVHSNNLRLLKDKKESAANSFPKHISRVDLESFKLRYEQMIEDENLEEIEQIIDFAIPRMSEHLRDGRELYDFVEDSLTIAPVGVLPINTEEGYMMIRPGGERDTQVFEYHITLFETADEKYRGIRALYVSTYTCSLAQTLEDIKLDLVKTHKQFVNPATFAITSEINFPLNETLLPVAKRTLVRYLGTASELPYSG
jgi:hypothetical protein